MQSPSDYGTDDTYDKYPYDYYTDGNPSAAT
jgi:hypothetical protein